MIVLYILLAILMFGFIIFSHELGHYTFARIFHVKIHEFSIGMGPSILSKTSKKTDIRYSFRALPFGGYVSMAGEDEDSEDADALCNKPVWQRMIIVAAGGITNLLLGFLVMTLIVCFTQNLGSTVVADFPDAESVTEEFALQSGDEILSVDGARVHVYSDLSYEIMHRGFEPVDLVVLRDGEEVLLKDVSFPTFTEQGHVFGEMNFRVYRAERTVLTVIGQSYWQCVNTVKMIWESLIDILRGNYGIKDMSGPVGVTEAITSAAQTGGARSMLTMFVFLSVNIGLFNLFPLPALDGGRLFFMLIELIFRKPVNRRVEGTIHTIGLALLLLLMAVITLKDVINLF